MNNAFSKRVNAPNDFSTNAVIEFKTKMANIKCMMMEKNYQIINSNTTIKEQITAADEDMIGSFLNANKENKDFLTIIEKVRLIDYINSTNLRMHGSEIYSDTANIILGITDFDDRVKKEDPKLVSDVAKEIKRVTDVNLFSFVTKYCCYHNHRIYGRDDYSIFDTAMKKAISKYINVTQTYIDRECREKMDYELYHSIVGNMIKEYGITTETPRRDTDYYLWSIYR